MEEPKTPRPDLNRAQGSLASEYNLANRLDVTPNKLNSRPPVRTLSSAYQSPLTQQSPPAVFEAKIVGLYRLVLQTDDERFPDGFWHEFFLLKPELSRLRLLLEETDAETLIHLQASGFVLCARSSWPDSSQNQTQQLVYHAVQCISNHDQTSENALDTLNVFFVAIYQKKFTNPSADVIQVIAGLDNVDAIFHDLVVAIEGVIRAETFSLKTSTAIVSGGYQTALVTYFLQRDLFAATVKLLRQVDSPNDVSEAIILMGLLSSHSKFEATNQYRTRFADFVDDEIMNKIVQCMSWSTTKLRDQYVAISDDLPTSWSLGGTLSYIGLGSLTSSKAAAPVQTEEQQKIAFGEQPDALAVSILTVYEFVSVNKLFAHRFVDSVASDPNQSPPFGTFVSFASYLFDHSYRSLRASSYSFVVLTLMRILIEDPVTARSICEVKAPARLCRQRVSNLPIVSGDRTYASQLLDALNNAINGNLRKRLDTSFYNQIATVIYGLISHLVRSRTKIEYHWSELWRTLLSFIRFLVTYSSDLEHLPAIQQVVDTTTDTLALTLAFGEAFLSDPAAFDDFFYKLIESSEALCKLRDAYAKSSGDPQTRSITTLIKAVEHYNELIAGHKAKKEYLSPREVKKLIRQGYETLPITTLDTMFEGRTIYREVDYKVELKKFIRIAVADATVLASRL